MRKELQPKTKATAAVKSDFKWQDVTLTHFYTDKSGQHWYKFPSVEQMPFRRLEAYFIALSNAELRVTDELLDKRLNQIFTAFSKLVVETKQEARQSIVKEFNDVFGDLQQRRSLAAEFNTCLALAKTFVLHPDEPQNPSVSETKHWNDKKERLWVQDEDAMAFFLGSAGQLVLRQDGISNLDLGKFLKKQASITSMKN